MAIDVYKEWLGIPPGPRPPDHYQLLRTVQFEDDLDKIRSNYRKLNAHVRKYATGQYQLESQELLNELAKAMLCLTDEQRKREYDKSLGREFDDDEEAGRKRPIEEILRAQGHVNDEQIAAARDRADSLGLSLRDAFVQLKLVDPVTATMALAQEYGLPYIDLAESAPDEELLDCVPKRLVKSNSVLPLFIDDATLLVACADQLSQEVEDELRLRFGVRVRPVLAAPAAINEQLQKHYGPGMREKVKEPPRTASAAAAKPAAERPAAKPRSRGAAEEMPAPAPAHAPRRVAASAMTEEDRRQRRQIGIIVICWGIVIPVLLDQFVMPRGSGFILSMIVPPLVAAASYFTFFR